MKQGQTHSSFDFIIFGATGDLTKRKLLPALFYRYLDQEIPSKTRIIGAARSQLSNEEFRAQARDGLNQFVQEPDRNLEKIEAFLQQIFYISLNGAEAESNWPALRNLLSSDPQNDIRIFYLATSPKLYGAICDNLSNEGLITENSRVVLEKPIGTSLATAQDINNSVGKHFPENHIFRIDHYLGKETVQNIIALRFANPVFERLWNSDVIDYVQITAAETVGIGNRGGYYDGAGALRDMVQNHLLQVLCMVAMDPPISLEADDLRNEKLKILRSLSPMSEEDIRLNTVRGQYDAGMEGNKPVSSYLEDLKKENSNTETYVAICAHVNTSRWSSVPFYLRTGKRMAEKTSEVVIQFKRSAWSLFPTMPEPNRLHIRIQPDEGVSLSLQVKDPSKSHDSLRSTFIDIDFSPAFHIRYPDAYEGLLMDVVEGDPLLFIRNDEVEAAWRWVEPILKGWSKGLVPLSHYKSGSWGPNEANKLLAKNGHLWHEVMP